MSPSHVRILRRAARPAAAMWHRSWHRAGMGTMILACDTTDASTTTLLRHLHTRWLDLDGATHPDQTLLVAAVCVGHLRTGLLRSGFAMSDDLIGPTSEATTAPLAIATRRQCLVAHLPLIDTEFARPPVAHAARWSASTQARIADPQAD